ncbi:MAG TPA: PAS domain-containing protein [Trinickia sp.]|nr:PAS domain-containing protein [Trinickia sp.]
MQRCISQPLSSTNEIAEGLGKTFSPSCEVVTLDLLDAEYVIVRIHNNLSGRCEGERRQGWRLRA